ncbi:MAG: presqualene diphosphate synthase HpnD [Zetaproteobacteria bacterium]|nr:presqualene diphosphate synthase HpnD [Zetaproteobacteria bacterium]
MNPSQYCEEKTRGSGSSFYYAFLFLEEEKRRAMMALYAFCREVDDIADEISEEEVAIQKIHFWREELHRAFNNQPQHPVGRELQWAKDHFSLDEELFIEVLDGMLMDISGKPILKSSDLSLYCYRVAGVVGLLSIEIFGYQSRKARDFATSLGEALQLTNILRDLKQDAAIGRIYLPQEDRIRFKVADQDFKEGNISEGMATLLQHYGEKAESAYTNALEQLPEEDRESLRPSLLMASIYYAQFKRLKNHEFDSWRHSAQISPLQKIWIAWRTWRYEKKAVKAAAPRPVRLAF